MGKLKTKITEILIGVAAGMSKANEEILRQCDSSNSAPDTSHNQVIGANQLLQSLLNGEVTEQVQEFRYAFYKVYEESKKKKVDPETINDYKRLLSSYHDNNEEDWDEENVDAEKRKEINEAMTQMRVMDSGYVENEHKPFFTQQVKVIDEQREGFGLNSLNIIYDYNVKISYKQFPLRRIINYMYSLSVDEEAKICRFSFFTQQPNEKGSAVFLNRLTQLGSAPRNPKEYEALIGAIDSIEFLSDKCKGLNDNMLVQINGLKFDPARFNFKNDGSVMSFDMPYEECCIESRDPRIIYFNEAMAKKYEENAAKPQNLSIIPMETYKVNGHYECNLCEKVMTKEEAERSFKEYGYIVCDKCAEAMHNKKQME